MLQFIKLAITSTFCFLLITNPLQAEIYKWVDKNGKVHYSDKPIDDNSTEIKVRSGPSESQRKDAQANTQSLIQRQTRIRENQIEEKKDLKEAEAEQNKLDGLCHRAKKELELLQTPVRLYETEKGEFLSDEERKKQIAIYNEAIKTYCGE